MVEIKARDSDRARRHGLVSRWGQVWVESWDLVQGQREMH